MADESLDNKRVDRITSLAKGVAGAVPVIGPLVAEVIGNIIPNQRVDRIKRFVVELEKRLGKLEEGELREKLSKEKFIDLLEDGFWHAARATSQERIEHIASVIANGLSDSENEHIKHKKLASILNELNDHEILFLIARNRGPEFREQHKDILEPVVASTISPPEVVYKRIFQESCEDKLVNLGLLRRKLYELEEGKGPEFDSWKKEFKSDYCVITDLGEMLLTALGERTRLEREFERNKKYRS